MRHNDTMKGAKPWLVLGLPLGIGLFLAAAFLWLAGGSWQAVHADPIPPPEGYPKFLNSSKWVSPTLAATGGETLAYRIEIINTGAYTAAGTTLVDVLPAEVTYQGDAWASEGPAPVFNGQQLTWSGDVGFDNSVVITYTVVVTDSFSGLVANTAVISHPLATRETVLTAETLVTDDPLFTVEKWAEPQLPGANKPLTYTLTVANIGQPAINYPITVTDHVPLSTTLQAVGPDGQGTDNDTVVTWNRNVHLDTGESTEFYFSVLVDEVVSGTVLTNDQYQVSAPGGQVTAGEAYTTTVVDPILLIAKTTWPDPPGSNREMTYTLTLLNKGSLATGLVITDRVPSGVEYRRVGIESDGVVSWTYPRLATGELAEFEFTVYITDVMDVPVLNADYGACSAEGICVMGKPITRVVDGPHFELTAEVYPIAKKPGAGKGPVTPTFTIRNLGPGNALGAQAYFEFERINVTLTDLQLIPAGKGSIENAPDCGSQCFPYYWTGDLNHGEVVTITTFEGQNSQIGSEGTIYSATITITDALGIKVTEPITATATGKVTHLANLIPEKFGPAEIGAGEAMTYVIEVWNSGLSTDETDFWPHQVLTESVPLSTTLLWASNGGISTTISNTTHISWSLPHLGPGDRTTRSFAVRVADGLVSGTEIVNAKYGTLWWENEDKEFFSLLGEPVTTTVREVGLIDSFKTVTPSYALPGPGNVFTYTVHLVNSGPHYLYDVAVYDYLPWQDSTYRRDATASSGAIISDIVSVQWQGEMPPYQSVPIEMSVLVDPDYSGPLTNRAVISHTSLVTPVVVEATAYVTDKPVLHIGKSAVLSEGPDGDQIKYTLQVVNLGLRATELEIVDQLPGNTSYVAGSASQDGQLVNDEVRWEVLLLEPGESLTFQFTVDVNGGFQVVNDNYWVSAAEGVTAYGEPVITILESVQSGPIYLPAIIKP